MSGKQAVKFNPQALSILGFEKRWKLEDDDVAMIHRVIVERQAAR